MVILFHNGLQLHVKMAHLPLTAIAYRVLHLVRVGISSRNVYQTHQCDLSPLEYVVWD